MRRAACSSSALSVMKAAVACEHASHSVPVLEAVGEEGGCGAGPGVDRRARGASGSRGQTPTACTARARRQRTGAAKLLGGEFVVAGGAVTGAVPLRAEGDDAWTWPRPSPAVSSSSTSPSSMQTPTALWGCLFGLPLSSRISQ
jgi:hypothetical protein